MPEQNRERLFGNTVEQGDAQKIAAVRSNIAQHTRERYGLPSDPVINDVEVISPKSLVGDRTVPESRTANLNPQKLPPKYSTVARYYRRIRVKAQEARLKKAA